MQLSLAALAHHAADRRGKALVDNTVEHDMGHRGLAEVRLAPRLEVNVQGQAIDLFDVVDSRLRLSRL